MPSTLSLSRKQKYTLAHKMYTKKRSESVLEVRICGETNCEK